MPNDALLTTVITAVIGPIVVLYIANRVKNSKPKSEQIYTAFNMYESLAKRQDQELQRKDKIIADQATELERLRRRE